LQFFSGSVEYPQVQAPMIVAPFIFLGCRLYLNQVLTPRGTSKLFVLVIQHVD
jgi:hypothetical protein